MYFNKCEKSMSNKILFLGGSGFIGKEILPLMKLHGYDVEYPNSSELDLTNLLEVNNFFKNKFYDVIIFSAVQGRKTFLDKQWDTFYNNILMFENVYRYKNRTKLFINIDSGLSIQNNFEKYPYSFSKYCISQRVFPDTNSINLRLYGCFGHNEEKRRHFVGNILRYINKEPMVIHQDRIFDFIYSGDLYKIIDWVIKNRTNTLPKNIDCTYTEKYKLSDICNLINTLDDYKVDIFIENSEIGDEYTSSLNDVPIKYDGMFSGIQQCFKNLRG